MIEALLSGPGAHVDLDMARPRNLILGCSRPRMADTAFMVDLGQTKTSPLKIADAGGKAVRGSRRDGLFPVSLLPIIGMLNVILHD
jgi:hypothetical protein